MVICDVKYDTKIWPNPPKLPSGTINILQVWMCSWCTYNHARKLKSSIQLRNDKLCWFMMWNLISETIQSSKTPVRNHQCPQSMTVLDVLMIMLGSWEFEYNSGMTNMLIHYIKFDIRDNPILQNSSQEQPLPSKHYCVLDAF